MKFTTGDAIVHPIRGAGVVERTWHGNAESYYKIRLLVGEIAATQDIEFADVDTQFRARLKEHSSSA